MYSLMSKVLATLFICFDSHQSAIVTKVEKLELPLKATEGQIVLSVEYIEKHIDMVQEKLLHFQTFKPLYPDASTEFLKIRIKQVWFKEDQAQAD